MRVIDFTWEGFDVFLKGVVANLECDKSSILVLGVAEGGLPIADYVCSFIRSNYSCHVERSNVFCQRPSTLKKKSSTGRKIFLRRLFELSPRFLLDALRVLEHRILAKRKNKDSIRVVSFESDAEAKIKESDIVLIVDDAVDSGSSLCAIKSSIIDLVANCYEKPVLKSLAVVLTQKMPIAEPDFIWTKDVLVRFPWSLDAK